MPSHRIEHYFPPIPRPSTVKRRLTILDLPYSVRERIYDYSYLIGDLVDLNWANFHAAIRTEFFEASHTNGIHFPCHHHDIPIRRDASTEGENWVVNLPDDQLLFLPDTSCRWCECENAYNLLFVSRQISKEAMNLLYAQSTFKIDQSMPNGLKRLKALGPDPLSILRCLFVRLDVPRSHVDLCENFHSWPEPLDACYKHHRTLIQEWSCVLDRLATLIRPDQLELYLCFCATNVDTIEKVLLPLEQLPELRHYGIWTDIPPACSKLRLEHDEECRVKGPLSYLRHRDRSLVLQISSLVEQSAKRLKIRPFNGSPFRYLDLPQEIRSLILEYSDLSTTEGIQWRPNSQSRNLVAPCSCAFDVLEEAGGCVCTFQNQRYYDSMNNRPMLYSDLQLCCGECGPSDENLFCYCSTTDAIWSSRCKCQRRAHPLFYVSKQVRQDALPVYYSCNRIVITAYGCPSMNPEKRRIWEPPVAHALESKSELSLYMSGLARGAIGHIRWLEWALPEHQHGFLNRRYHMWRDYLDTVQMMEHAMNVPKLTLVVNMSSFGSYFCEWEMYFRTPQDLCTNRAIWRRYADMIMPMTRLHHLKDFFVYLRRDTPTTFREALEKEFEQLIKGPDYHSEQRGKPEERFRWFESYQRAMNDY